MTPEGNLSLLECPFDLPAATEAKHLFRLDETLRTLWSLGAGESVSLAIIARHLKLTETDAFDWLQNNGQNYWESVKNGQRWKPLIGKHRNY